MKFMLNIPSIRRDRARLIGCHVGPVALRGCGIGCCPYSRDKYEDIIYNERYDWKSQCDHPQIDRIATETDEERISRVHRECINPYRPKYVCLDCRVAFKGTIVDPDGKEFRYHSEPEYHPRPYQVRPDREHIPDVWKAYLAIWGRRKQNPEAWNELHEMGEKFAYEGSEGFTYEEIKRWKQCNPDFWWVTLDNKRCPSCGKKGTSVGGTFRAPAKKDAKGWEQVKKMLDDGHEFSYCMAREQQVEAYREGERLRGREQAEEAWKAEKALRIQILQDASRRGGRTEEEIERLRALRSAKATGE
ncbi:hypothetical protein K474DRAFT_1713262 [Panus rudis PR-1116 ss-1]|nr:hypothetical protein K474DRAFT_1713262 [Panus rudis PR-1116 ss-1]